MVVCQHFEEPHGVRRAGRAGDGEDEWWRNSSHGGETYSLSGPAARAWVELVRAPPKDRSRWLVATSPQGAGKRLSQNVPPCIDCDDDRFDARLPAPSRPEVSPP